MAGKSWREYGIETDIFGNVKNQQDVAAPRMARLAFDESGISPEEEPTLFDFTLDRARRIIYAGGGSAQQVMDDLKREVIQRQRGKTGDMISGYGSGTGPTAATPAAATPAAAAAPADKSLLDQMLESQQARPNPYGQQYIQGAQQQAQLAFAPQQQALSSALAGRGMLGSGQEVAQRAALGGAQARSLFDIAQNARDQGINWQQGQDAQVNNLALSMAGLGQGQQRLDLGADQFNREFKYRQENTPPWWMGPVNAAASGVGSSIGKRLGGG